MSLPFCNPTACAEAGCDAATCSGAGVRSNAELFARSAAVIPGGVNSSIRAFKAVGGDPVFMARGAGAYLEDVDGRRYARP